MSLRTILPKSGTWPILPLALVALPYFLNLGVSSLWDANESFYAETPREMMETGDYLAPHFNYQIRAQKPPLTYWAILLSYRVFGVSEFAVRLPGALAALGVLLFTYGMGRILFSTVTAVIAAIILGTTARFFLLARKLPIDILLLFFLTGAAYFLVRLLHKSDRSPHTWILLYVFLGLGFMTKGPVALLIPALAWLLHTLSTGRRQWMPPHAVVGSAIVVSITLPWYGMVYLAHGWSYIAPFFLRDNLARFTTETFGPARGPFYYFSTYLSDFFPWSILSLGALLLIVVDRKNLLRRENSPYPFLLIWSSTVLILFSLSKNKQEYYIVPLYPFMALVLAGVLEATRSSKPIQEIVKYKYLWIWIYCVVASLMTLLAFLILILAPGVFPDWSVFERAAPAAILIAGSIGLAWRIVRTDLVGALAAISLALWCLVLAGAVHYLPRLEYLRPVEQMCTVVEREATAQDQAGYYRVSVPSMVFYLRRPIFEEFDRDSMVARFNGHGRIFCILTQEDYNYFVGRRDLILYVLDRRPRLVTQLRAALDEEARVRMELLLVSNRPLSESEAQERLTP